MSQVFENLYLGSVAQACTPDYLSSLSITHVLTLDIEPVKNLDGIISKFIRAIDHPEFDLLSHFDDCYDFIENSFNDRGKLFVHCQLGVSRSATIVAAYLMRKYDLSVSDAIARLREIRLISPNAGFMNQLTLYEKMGKRLDKKNVEYREYILNKIAASPKNVDIPDDILPDDDLETCMDGRSRDGHSRGLYRCRKCRKHLFTSDAITKKHDLVNSSSVDRCSDNLFIVPLRWMLNDIRRENGKILCPNCKAKLGAFIWAGERCGCGTWVTPSFRIQQCKLDTQTIVGRNDDTNK